MKSTRSMLADLTAASSVIDIAPAMLMKWLRC
jgi:hypothetical protein